MFAELCCDDGSADVAGLFELVFVIHVSEVGGVVRHVHPPLLILAPFVGAFGWRGWRLRSRLLGLILFHSSIIFVFKHSFITHNYIINLRSL